MNKYVKEGLENCILANIPEYDDDTTHMVIPKSSLGVAAFLRTLEIGHSYLIHVEDYILHPFEGFTLHSAWNNDIIPTDDEMIVYVEQSRGNLYKVSARGKHDNKPWQGWLPLKSIKIVGEIDHDGL